MALGALPSASSAQDIGDVCASLIGSNASTINLSPLANINLATCKAATVPSCGAGTTIPLGALGHVTIALCKP